MDPITIRVDSAFEIKRWTLHDDRLVIQGRDPIVGVYSAEKSIFLDDIAVVTYSKKTVLIHLAWALLGALLLLPAAEGVFAARRPQDLPVTLLSVGAFFIAFGLWMGLKGRPYIRLRDSSGYECEARMDRPLLRPGKRRAFFGGLLRALELDLPRGVVI